jgi:hypothetical protein
MAKSRPEFTATGGWRRHAGEPATYRLADPNDGVTFRIEIDDLEQDKSVTIEYIAAPQTLVASGVCTPELVGPWKPGATRRDQDGDRALLDRRKAWVRLRLCDKSVANALKLPGVTLARINEEREAWRQACAHPASPTWMRDQLERCTATAPVPLRSRPHPHLRLVVDNTRSEASHE